MNIIIYGASGATGHELVKQGLEQGYKVTAFVRNPAKLTIRHPNLIIIKGDVTDYAAVDNALKHQDAVLCALGAASPFKYDAAVVNGMQHILQGMEENSIKRLIYLSFIGVRESRHQGGFLIKHIVPKILHTEIGGHEARENLIRQSRLQWTIVRPPTLTNGKYKAVFRSGETMTSKKFIVSVSRADVADFMLQQLQSSSYIKKAPALMY